MMQLKPSLTLLLIITLTVFGVKSLQGQKKHFRPNVLLIRGFVSYGNQDIDSSLVLLYQNDKIVKKVQTERYSEFQFLLFRDSKYMIEIHKEGFIVERILISKESTDFSDRKYTFDFCVDLMNVNDFAGLGITAFDFPTAKINFCCDDNDYIYDVAYDKKIKAKIDKLKKMSISISNQSK
jgi:hypothetical protein